MPCMAARLHCTLFRRLADIVRGSAGPGVCDHNGFERIVNLATSIPYGITGAHIFRCGAACSLPRYSIDEFFKTADKRLQHMCLIVMYGLPFGLAAALKARQA